MSSFIKINGHPAEVRELRRFVHRRISRLVATTSQIVPRNCSQTPCEFLAGVNRIAASSAAWARLPQCLRGFDLRRGVGEFKVARGYPVDVERAEALYSPEFSRRLHDDCCGPCSGVCFVYFVVDVRIDTDRASDDFGAGRLIYQGQQLHVM